MSEGSQVSKVTLCGSRSVSESLTMGMYRSARAAKNGKSSAKLYLYLVNGHSEEVSTFKN